MNEFQFVDIQYAACTYLCFSLNHLEKNKRMRNKIEILFSPTADRQIFIEFYQNNKPSYRQPAFSTRMVVSSFVHTNMRKKQLFFALKGQRPSLRSRFWPQQNKKYWKFDPRESSKAKYPSKLAKKTMSTR